MDFEFLKTDPADEHQSEECYGNVTFESTVIIWLISDLAKSGVIVHHANVNSAGKRHPSAD